MGRVCSRSWGKATCDGTASAASTAHHQPSDDIHDDEIDIHELACLPNVRFDLLFSSVIVS